jgi:putative Holliday junction resolvase
LRIKIWQERLKRLRIMGIDFGDSRIGIALSDPLGITAQAYETIKWSHDLNKPLDRIQQIIKENSVTKIVVGFPKNMNGTIGPRGEKTIEFIDLLSELTGLEIIKWDERLTDEDIEKKEAGGPDCCRFNIARVS